MAITSGETLSLNGLAAATGNTQNANVSLGSIKGTPVAGDNISLSSYGIDAVGAVTGYTYAVEGLNETYTLNFTGDIGSRFPGQIANRYQNFTWSVTPTFNSDGNTAGFLSIAANQDVTAVITVGVMNPQAGTQQTLMGAQSHTLSSTFADGYNDHATNYNSARTKTVYSVDSYDGNSTALCLTIDSPVTLADGTTIEVGDLEEGDVLRGFSIGGLGTEESGFLDWNTDTLTTEVQNVTVENLVYSFSNRHYDINDGEITATGEHPMLVKDASDGNYRFLEMFNITTDDKLIKEIDGVITEVDIVSIEIVNQTNEIVSIDVETNDTYLVNGYITHNKGGNSHTDETAGSAPTSLAWTNATHTLAWPAISGDTLVHDVQIDNNSDFSSPLINETQWSEGTVVTTTDGGSFDIGTGTRYARVRRYATNGLVSEWSSTLTFTVS
tara:strand:+ start:427 stop:1749 length:1323 start_codon:yes stop_codon:yes gene_type:complete